MAFLGPLFAGITGAVNTIVAGSNPGGGSGLQNKEEAAYPSYQEFLAFSKQYDQSPSLGNLFSVHFSPTVGPALLP